MKRFLNPKIIIPVAVVVVLLGLVGYVLLAPSTWWKPFYVRMEMSEAPVESSPIPHNGAGQQSTTLPSQEMSAQPGGGSSSGIGGVQQVANMQQQPGIMYELSNKVVNLAEPGGLRYLQTSIVLELWPLQENYYILEDKERETAEEEFEKMIDARRPIIDDIITTKLSSKSFNEVATIEGKQKLKEELLTAINDALGYEGVINVYFTSFVVQ